MDHAIVEAHGKLNVSSKDGMQTMLSDLNVLVFRHSDGGDSGYGGIYTHTAACIQLELDASGNSFEEAVEGLKRCVNLYINAMADEYDVAEEFAQDLLGAVYSRSKQKEELFRLYERAERDSLRDMVRKNKMQTPKTDIFNIIPFLNRNEAAGMPAAAMVN